MFKARAKALLATAHLPGATGKVIGEGFHHRAGEPHAERMAIQDVNSRHGPAAADLLHGSTLYCTLEPTIARSIFANGMVKNFG